MAGCISRPFRAPSSRVAALLSVLLAASAVSIAADKSADSSEAARVTAVRFWSLGDTTRIAIEVSGDFHFKSERLDKPDRLFFDVFGARPEMARHGVETIPVDDPIVKQLRVAETQPGVTRVVIDLKQAVGLSTSQLNNPSRLIVELKTPDAKPKDADKPSPAVVSGGRSLPEPAPAGASASVLKLDGKSASSTKTDAFKAEPAKTEVSKVEKIDPAKPLSAKAQVDRTRTDKGKTDQAKINQANIDQSKTDQVKIDPAKSDQAKSDQIRAGSDTKPKPLVEVASARGSSRSTPLARVAPLSSSPISAAPVGAAPATIDSIAGDKPASATLASLPPEPVGVEPPASFPALDDLKRDDLKHDDSKRDGLKNDVKEVVPAKRPSLGDRSLTRALGLKLGRIVIDPGHGGNDVGTHGPSGYYEKDLTLDVARRLAEIVRENMGSDVVLTRSDDEYVAWKNAHAWPTKKRRTCSFPSMPIRRRTVRRRASKLTFSASPLPERPWISLRVKTPAQTLASTICTTCYRRSRFATKSTNRRN